ncbi:MFS transporter [Alkaliphilus pronyensis]|uniref:MFS transporter n=1 Tax=Alkaliphilus pronyensis TaxID=1482732 RepID=A0A6I0FB93_9FIRM|nr:MFS transporter [Alkaliphilus pronyensis]KAB3535245.1 MFS transporter [Alkaliphilus pronyensis]
MENTLKKNEIEEKIAVKEIVKKNIILISLGQLVSLFGSRIYSFAISLYILSVTGSGLNFSLTLALGTLPGVLFGPISGVIADRFDRKKMVVLLDVLSGVVVLGLLAASLIDELSLSYIYITTFLLSTCNVFFNTPLAASIPNLVDDENLTRINSLSHTISSLASIAGPFIGGLVYALIDIRLFLLVNGLSFIISGISEAFIDFKVRDRINGESKTSNKKENDKAKNNRFFTDLMDGLRYIATQKWLMVLGSFVVFFNMLIMMGLSVPVPYIVNEVWGFSSQQFGILNMMFPIGMLMASIVLSILPEVKNNIKRILICLSTFSVAIFIVGLLTSEIFIVLNNTQYLIILTILYLMMAVAAIFINVPVNVTLQRLIPDDMRGRVTGTLGTLGMALSPIGAIVAGALVDSISPWLLPMVSGIIMICITIYMSNVKDLKEI